MQESPAWIPLCRTGAQLEEQQKFDEAERYFQAAMEAIEKQMPNIRPTSPAAQRAAMGLLQVMTFYAKSIVRDVPKGDDAKDAAKVQERLDGQKKHMTIVQRTYESIIKLNPEIAPNVAKNVQVADTALKKTDAQLSQLQKQPTQPTGQPAG